MRPFQARPACAVCLLWPVAGRASQPCDEAAFLVLLALVLDPRGAAAHRTARTWGPSWAPGAPSLSSPLFSNSLLSSPLPLPIPASLGSPHLPQRPARATGQKAPRGAWQVQRLVKVSSSEEHASRGRLHGTDERPGWFWPPLSSTCCLAASGR